MPTWEELPGQQRQGWIYAASQAAQLYGNNMATPEKIYRVTTEGDCEGRSVRILGYASGSPLDIKNYYEPQKAYDLKVEQIVVKEITPQSATEREALVLKQKELKEQLESINNQLK